MRTRLALVVGSLVLLSGCGGGGLTDAEQQARDDAHTLAATVSTHGHLLELGRHSPQLDYCYGPEDHSHPIGATATYVYSLEGATRTERASALAAARRTFARGDWKVGTVTASSVDALNGERSALVTIGTGGSVSITTMTPCVRSDHPGRLKAGSGD